MRLSASLPAFSLIGLVLLTGAALPTSAAPYVGGTASWTLVGTPLIASIGQPAVALTYENNLNVTVLGIVIAVAHNSLGQTVYYSTSTLNLAAGANSTAYDVVFGLTGGNYNMTFFAVTTSGVAISTATTATLAI